VQQNADAVAGGHLLNDEGVDTMGGSSRKHDSIVGLVEHDAEGVSH
jgi:hypothetical protein